MELALCSQSCPCDITGSSERVVVYSDTFGRQTVGQRLAVVTAMLNGVLRGDGRVEKDECVAV